MLRRSAGSRCDVDVADDLAAGLDHGVLDGVVARVETDVDGQGPGAVAVGAAGRREGRSADLLLECHLGDHELLEVAPDETLDARAAPHVHQDSAAAGECSPAGDGHLVGTRDQDGCGCGAGGTDHTRRGTGDTVDRRDPGVGGRTEGGHAAGEGVVAVGRTRRERDGRRLADTDGGTVDGGGERAVTLGLTDHGVDGRDVGGGQVLDRLADARLVVVLLGHLGHVGVDDGRVLDLPVRQGEPLGRDPVGGVGVLVGEGPHPLALVGGREWQDRRGRDDVRGVRHVEVAVDASTSQKLARGGVSLVSAHPAAVGTPGASRHPDAVGALEGVVRDRLGLRSCGDRGHRQADKGHQDGDHRHADQCGQPLRDTHEIPPERRDATYNILELLTVQTRFPPRVCYTSRYPKDFLEQRIA